MSWNKIDETQNKLFAPSIQSEELGETILNS